MKMLEYINLENKFGVRNYKPLDVVLSRGKGIWVWDIDGRKYLDFLSSYSAVNQGHCHPEIFKTLSDQAQKLPIISRAFRNDQLPLFYKEICDLTKSEKVLPMNTGAEAVETALKAVRKWGYLKKNVPSGKAEIIVCEHNFHGRTTTVVGFSSDENSKTNFGPFTPGFKIIPYGNTGALENAITGNTVAFLVEPIQGEAGVIIPPEGYLQKIRDICTKNKILLILDEIQTGFGRTGRLFAKDHEDVQPDLMLVGKALSGGFYPVSAVLGTEEALDVFEPGQHGSTFGGNPLACATARAAMRVLIEEKMAENSAKMGKYFIDQLNTIKNKRIKEIRGKGLMIGVELYSDTPGGARKYCEMLKEYGLLCKETHENIIRFTPPLIIQKNDIDWALEQIETVFRNLLPGKCKC